MHNKSEPFAELTNTSPDMRKELAKTVRPILQAVARIIATDRRAVVMANMRGEILLANQSSQRLGIDRERLLARLPWAGLCDHARRAGSASASWSEGNQTFEGELVHVPLGPAEGFLLRLAENDQESVWLRNRARAATLMRVAHDLRTPIQSLLASADQLMKGGEAAAAAGPQLRRAAELALDHISNVLAVIRGEQTPRRGLADEDFLIVEEITSLLAMMEPIAKARATDLSLSIEAPRDLALHGPLRFVRALCQNLIDNSVNHGGGHVKVRLSCRPLTASLDGEPATETWHVGIELADEGGGLPPAQKARLAEALGLPSDSAASQISSFDKRPSAGLNVLAHALRQLGGQIEIQDRGSDGLALPPGAAGRVVGTIFRVGFALPRAPEMARDQARTSCDAAPLAGRTLMLVEDSPSSRDWLTHLLQSFGATVVSVGSGAEALALLSRDDMASHVELVLTDVTLPRMTGIELAARLRSGDPTSAVTWEGQVMGLTAHVDDRIRAACLKAGMICVLEKPIQPDVLCAAVTQALSGSPPPETVRAQRTRPVPNPVDRDVWADLIQRLGAEAAHGFIMRALSEAQSILDELRADGIGPETRRRLHAATGAGGLTGLLSVEEQLRAIELAVESASTGLAPLLDRLDAALAETRRLADTLAVSGDACFPPADMLRGGTPASAGGDLESDDHD